ncbi:hypothetical protein J4E08_23935 [Sagittula sp. NFXS13]|uniref:hypothetical protein n=1 Tax=Sagittula sp. NFXS13 TaxID=2819095 RepID=UPI0032DFDD07
MPLQAIGDAKKDIAEGLGVTARTVKKRCKRDFGGSRSQAPHELHSALTPAQETVALPETLLASLNDLLAGGD